MDPLSQTIQSDLPVSQEVEVSDWVRNAITSATRLEAHDYERTLAKKLIQQAYISATNKKYSVGTSFTESHIRDEWLQQIFSF
jgi:hypothetical protein